MIGGFFQSKLHAEGIDNRTLVLRFRTANYRGVTAKDSAHHLRDLLDERLFLRLQHATPSTGAGCDTSKRCRGVRVIDKVGFPRSKRMRLNWKQRVVQGLQVGDTWKSRIDWDSLQSGL